MQNVKVTRNTSVDGKTAFEGDVLAVSDHTARVLIGYGAAETTTDEPKKLRKSKQSISEGE